MQNEIYNMGLDESLRPLGSKPIEGVFCKKEADEAYGSAQPVRHEGLFSTCYLFSMLFVCHTLFLTLCCLLSGLTSV